MGWDVLLWGSVNVLQNVTDGGGDKKIGKSVDVIYGRPLIQPLNSTKVDTFLGWQRTITTQRNIKYLLNLCLHFLSFLSRLIQKICCKFFSGAEAVLRPQQRSLHRTTRPRTPKRPAIVACVTSTTRQAADAVSTGNASSRQPITN
jgi:hypothetical protein